MASSSSSDFSSGEITAPPKQRKGPPFMMLVPLIYAPVLPLIRIGFRHNPVLRDRLFYGVLAGAFAHGTYLMYPFNLKYMMLRVNEDAFLFRCWLRFASKLN
ncbi:SH3/FCH domain protein [Rhynchospora pubera]|uniref:SH3/FCH domain protein n=1 Tax=Rhynchospora pubera TaxID=906938 RepID=A0AAV8CBS3_9POAL|nr:SH3/FCH domain protein [Rhynchospora pubera]